MSSSAPWLESVSPTALSILSATAKAGPIDTAPARAGAVFERDDQVVLEITGRDRSRFLHAMLSNDVAAMERAGPGHGIRAALNSLKGRLVADLHLYLVDAEKKTGSMLAVMDREAAEGFVAMLDRYVIAEKVYFEPADLAVLAVVGDGAAAALTEAGADLPAEGAHTHVAATIGGVRVRIARQDLGTGADFAVLVATADRDAVRSALGLPTPPPEVFETLRIEAALPRPGADVTGLHIVLEGGLKDRSVSFTKGCYIGQEVICRIDSMGTPARLLVQLDGAADVPDPGTELFVDGRAVGYVTSAAHSVRRGGPVLLGYVKKKKNDVGATVHVGSADGPEATIAAHV